MLLHRDPHVTEELPRIHPDELEQLPELPEGVVVPDDLRGLTPGPPKGGVRWLRWAVALVVAAGVALAVALVLTGDSEQLASEARVEQDTRDYYQHLYESTAPIRIEQDTKGYYQQLYDSTAPIRIEQDTKGYYQQLYDSTASIRVEQDVRDYYRQLYEAIG